MTDRYDMLVIGGGINGTGVAQAAAAAGYSVLVLEKSLIGSGTSSRSSKLIHGGLRYLETMELSLVRESLYERSLMLRLAPELVKLRRFFIPIYETTRRRPWQIRTGLSLYAVLAGFDHGTEFGSLPKTQWDSLDGLRTRRLQKVFFYHDAQTDDQALTRAVMASAVKLGAQYQENARFHSANLGENGCEINFESDGREHSCTASVIVNAGGPWVNHVLAGVRPACKPRKVELVQGAHLVVPGEIERGCYYTESRRDGRAIFVMPWKGATLVGTTETRYRGHPDKTHALRAEKNYLTAILTHHFPRYREAVADGRAQAFAGLRVLPAGEGHAFHRSREVIIDVDRKNKPRLASIYGGKLTTWRATAAKVVRRLRASLPERQERAGTDEIALEPVD